MILKKSCRVPAAMAFLNSFFLVIYPNDTIVLVRVVPILAPIIIGIALEKLKAPEATTATIMEVLVELLWIMAVINNPMNKLTKGFEVAIKIDSAAPLPNLLTELPTKSIENKKRAIPQKTKKILMILLFQDLCLGEIREGLFITLFMNIPKEKVILVSGMIKYKGNQ